MEDITQGERVREYSVEVLAEGGEWKQVVSGQSIGHKWINRFAWAKTAGVRLRVTRCVASPRIRKMAVFSAA